MNAVHDPSGVPFDFTSPAAPDGTYSLFVSANDYRIAPVAPPNRFFVPSGRVVSVAGPGTVPGLDFTEMPPGTIAVTASSTAGPLAAFRLTATAADNASFSGSSGDGEIATLTVPPGIFTVVPEKSCSVFTPPSQTAFIGTWGDTVALAFDVTPPDRTTRHLVSGTAVSPYTASPVSGITILLEGEGLHLSTVSDSGGYFFFSVPNGDYALSASGSGKTLPVFVCDGDQAAIRIYGAL